MEIIKNLIGHNRVTIPINILKEFHVGQMFKIEVVENGIKLVAVSDYIPQSSRVKQENEYVKSLDANKLHIPTKIMQQLKLETNGRVTVKYEEGEQEILILVNNNRCSCAFCGKKINSINEKEIVSTAKNKQRIAICSDCFKKLGDKS